MGANDANKYNTAEVDKKEYIFNDCKLDARWMQMLQKLQK